MQSLSRNVSSPSQEIMEWISKYTLTRSVKNIARDFADAVLLAEILKLEFPRLVELNNYPTTNRTAQKIENWKLLQSKVLKKLGVKLSEESILKLTKFDKSEFLLLLMEVKLKIGEKRRLTVYKDGKENGES